MAVRHLYDGHDVGGDGRAPLHGGADGPNLGVVRCQRRQLAGEGVCFGLVGFNNNVKSLIWISLVRFGLV